jgi:hypothetical protein
MEDRAVLRDFEQGRGRRIVVMIIAVLALAIVIGAVVKGFRSGSTSRSSRALTDIPAEPKVRVPSPTAH